VIRTILASNPHPEMKYRACLGILRLAKTYSDQRLEAASQRALQLQAALHERHLRRLIRDYVNYHHEDRIHDSLDKDTPNRRPVDSRPSPAATVISSARLGGLHHRYNWREAA
jgi:hypothetical protein